MKKFNIVKLLSLMLCAVMLLSVFAACEEETTTEAQTDAPTEEPTVADPTEDETTEEETEPETSEPETSEPETSEPETSEPETDTESEEETTEEVTTPEEPCDREHKVVDNGDGTHSAPLCDACGAVGLPAPHVNENCDAKCDECGATITDPGALVLDGAALGELGDKSTSGVTKEPGINSDGDYLVDRDGTKTVVNAIVNSKADMTPTDYGEAINVGSARYILIKYKLTGNEADPWRMIISTSGKNSTYPQAVGKDPVTDNYNYTGLSSVNLDGALDTWQYKLIDAPTALLNRVGGTDAKEPIYIVDPVTGDYMIDTLRFETRQARESSLVVGYIAFADSLDEVEAVLKADGNVADITSARLVKETYVSTAGHGVNPINGTMANMLVENGEFQHVNNNCNDTICDVCELDCGFSAEHVNKDCNDTECDYGCGKNDMPESEIHPNENCDETCDSCGATIADPGALKLTGTDLVNMTSASGKNGTVSEKDGAFYLEITSNGAGNAIWAKSALDTYIPNVDNSINVGDAKYIVIKYMIKMEDASKWTADEDYRLVISTAGKNSDGPIAPGKEGCIWNGVSSINLGIPKSGSNSEKRAYVNKWIYVVVNASEVLFNINNLNVPNGLIYKRADEAADYVIDTLYIDKRTPSKDRLADIMIDFIAFAEDSGEIDALLTSADSEVFSVESSYISHATSLHATNPMTKFKRPETVTDGKIQHVDSDADYKCDYCGVTIPEPPAPEPSCEDYKYDREKHWRDACEEHGVTAIPGEIHKYGIVNGEYACTVCGFMPECEGKHGSYVRVDDKKHEKPACEYCLQFTGVVTAHKFAYTADGYICKDCGCMPACDGVHSGLLDRGNGTHSEDPCEICGYAGTRAIPHANTNANCDTTCDACGATIADPGALVLDGAALVGMNGTTGGATVSVNGDGDFLYDRTNSATGTHQFINSTADLYSTNVGEALNVGQARYILIKYKVICGNGNDFRMIISTTGASSTHPQAGERYATTGEWNYSGISALDISSATKEWQYKLVDAPAALYNNNAVSGQKEPIYIVDPTTGDYIIDTLTFETRAGAASDFVIGYIAFADSLDEVETVLKADGNVANVNKVIFVQKTFANTAGHGLNPGTATTVDMTVASGVIMHVNKNCNDTICDVCGLDCGFHAEHVNKDCNDTKCDNCDYNEMGYAAHINENCDRLCDSGCGTDMDPAIDHYNDNCDSKCDGCGTAMTDPGAYKISGGTIAGLSKDDDLVLSRDNAGVDKCFISNEDDGRNVRDDSSKHLHVGDAKYILIRFKITIPEGKTAGGTENYRWLISTTRKDKENIGGTIYNGYSSVNIPYDSNNENWQYLMIPATTALLNGNGDNVYIEENGTDFVIDYIEFGARGGEGNYSTLTVDYIAFAQDPDEFHALFTEDGVTDSKLIVVTQAKLGSATGVNPSGNNLTANVSVVNSQIQHKTTCISSTCTNCGKINCTLDRHTPKETFSGNTYTYSCSLCQEPLHEITVDNVTKYLNPGMLVPGVHPNTAKTAIDYDEDSAFYRVTSGVLEHNWIREVYYHPNKTDGTTAGGNATSEFTANDRTFSVGNANYMVIKVRTNAASEGSIGIRVSTTAYNYDKYASNYANSAGNRGLGSVTQNILMKPTHDGKWYVYVIDLNAYLGSKYGKVVGSNDYVIDSFAMQTVPTLNDGEYLDFEYIAFVEELKDARELAKKGGTTEINYLGKNSTPTIVCVEHTDADKDIKCDVCKRAVDVEGVKILDGTFFNDNTNRGDTKLVDGDFVSSRDSGSLNNYFAINSTNDANPAPNIVPKIESINVGQAQYMVVKYQVSEEGGWFRLLISTTGKSSESIATPYSYTGYSTLALSAKTETAGKWIYQVIPITALQNYKGESVFVKDGTNTDYIIDTLYIQSRQDGSSDLTIGYIAFADDIDAVERLFAADTINDATIASVESVIVTKALTTKPNGSNPEDYSAITEMVKKGKLQHMADCQGKCTGCGYTGLTAIDHTDKNLDGKCDMCTTDLGITYGGVILKPQDLLDWSYSTTGESVNAAGNYQVNVSKNEKDSIETIGSYFVKAKADNGEEKGTEKNVGKGSFIVIKFRNTKTANIRFHISTKAVNSTDLETSPTDNDGYGAFYVTPAANNAWTYYVMDASKVIYGYDVETLVFKAETNGEYIIDTFLFEQTDNKLNSNGTMEIAYIAFMESIDEVEKLFKYDADVTSVKGITKTFTNTHPTNKNGASNATTNCLPVSVVEGKIQHANTNYDDKCDVCGSTVTDPGARVIDCGALVPASVKTDANTTASIVDNDLHLALKESSGGTSVTLLDGSTTKLNGKDSLDIADAQYMMIKIKTGRTNTFKLSMSTAAGDSMAKFFAKNEGNDYHIYVIDLNASGNDLNNSSISIGNAGLTAKSTEARIINKIIFSIGGTGENTIDIDYIAFATDLKEVKAKITADGDTGLTAYNVGIWQSESNHGNSANTVLDLSSIS